MNSLLLVALLLGAEVQPERSTVVVVVGAEGTPEYGEQFRQWSERWRSAAEQAEADFIAVGLDDADDPPDRDTLRQVLAGQPRDSAAPLWLVLIGHGTFDGRQARFNLRGPDVTPQDLSAWLADFQRPLAVINCASASSPFLTALSKPGRVIVSATRSGHEHNFARFGDYLSRAIADPAADLDKDGQTSLLEAFLSASRAVEDFYQQEARLATEHALLDDNGDTLGTPAVWFTGLRATRGAKDGAPLDGTRAHQFHLVPSGAERDMPPLVRARRDELELAIVRLRDTWPLQLHVTSTPSGASNCTANWLS